MSYLTFNIIDPKLQPDLLHILSQAITYPGSLLLGRVVRPTAHGQYSFHLTPIEKIVRVALGIFLSLSLAFTFNVAIDFIGIYFVGAYIGFFSRSLVKTIFNVELATTKSQKHIVRCWSLLPLEMRQDSEVCKRVLSKFSITQFGIDLSAKSTQQIIDLTIFICALFEAKSLSSRWHKESSTITDDPLLIQFALENCDDSFDIELIWDKSKTIILAHENLITRILVKNSRLAREIWMDSNLEIRSNPNIFQLILDIERPGFNVDQLYMWISAGGNIRSDLPSFKHILEKASENDIADIWQYSGNSIKSCPDLFQLALNKASSRGIYFIWQSSKESIRSDKNCFQQALTTALRKTAHHIWFKAEENIKNDITLFELALQTVSTENKLIVLQAAGPAIEKDLNLLHWCLHQDKSEGFTSEQQAAFIEAVKAKFQNIWQTYLSKLQEALITNTPLALSNGNLNDSLVSSKPYPIIHEIIGLISD